MRYRYLGDKNTIARYRGSHCEAVKRPDGKCIRGRNSNMLVRFDDRRLVVVPARLLRKLH